MHKKSALRKLMYLFGACVPQGNWLRVFAEIAPGLGAAEHDYKVVYGVLMVAVESDEFGPYSDDGDATARQFVRDQGRP